MTTLHQLTDNCLAVAGLPSDANRIVIRQNKSQSDLWYNIVESSYFVDLPTENWRILGKANELTEGQWKEIVEVLWDGFKNYALENVPVGNYKRLRFDTATESGASLLKLHKLENPLILIKVFP